MGTVATRLGGIRLVNRVELDARAGRFLAQVPHELAVRPLADLLVGHVPETDPRLNVAHIAHREAADALLLAEGDHFPGGLMQDLALLAIQRGADLGLAPQQAPGTPRALLAAAELFLEEGVGAVASLLAGAQQPPRDDQCLPPGAGDR